jgi:hypothetical protein
VKRRSAGPDQDAVAKDQALVVQLAEGAGEGDASGEAARDREDEAGERREREHVRVLAENQGQHGALGFEMGRHLRTLLRKLAAGCST